ncbi:FKBP12-associated protein [Malassezia sp. CBS 17886]|nr:FKBP12-associated protein [Malassezia sp. CBS 17886]
MRAVEAHEEEGADADAGAARRETRRRKRASPTRGVLGTAAAEPAATAHLEVPKPIPRGGKTRGRGRQAQRASGRGAVLSHDATVPPPATRARRFQATLTHADADARARTTPRVETEALSLRERLVAELSGDDYDCIICYNSITRRNAVWDCSRCYAVFHLGCVRRWAERSVKDVEEQNPHTIPHSCGGACGRGCAWHGCAAPVCHPGPCPPCAASVSVACFCGKQGHLTVRCSQLSGALAQDVALADVRAEGRVSCGASCGRTLACGHHTCAEPCHEGPCTPCTATLADAPCYCGTSAKTLLCRDRDAASCAAPDAASAWSCGRPCGAPFACGEHRCERPCHLRTPGVPVRCPYAPDAVLSCPCGRTPAPVRTKCTDPVPTCTAACARTLACGHTCAARCHTGDCPPCRATVRQVCRCGAEKRSVACCTAGTFTCTAPCHAQRSCMRHQCTRVCCPLAFHATLTRRRTGIAATDLPDPDGVHTCERMCGRALSCGTHTCEAPCHRGACAPCLRSAFHEVACACGRTVLEPPVRCGTKVTCTYPCARGAPACGHPPTPHACHPDDVACPACVYLTRKPCVCGRTELAAVPCARTNARCGAPCGALLACGAHRCTGTCHRVPEECGSCTQPCGRPRKHCEHACMQPCHAPAPCDDDAPCTAVVVRRCPCGHREKMDVCGGSTDALACTADCKTAQRNARFASALGLAAATRDAQYSDDVLRYAAQDRRVAAAVQDALGEFIQSPRAAAQLRSALSASAARTFADPVRVDADLLAFAAALASVYGLDAEPCAPDGVLRPRDARVGDLSVRRTRTSRIPAPLLTEVLDRSPARGTAAPGEAPRVRAAAPRRLDAVVLSGLPAPLAADLDVLDAALAPVRGARRWRLARSACGRVVVHTIQLPPLSLAAVAAGTGSAKPGASLTTTEMRLVGVRDDVRAALASAGVSGARVVLAAYGGGAGATVTREWDECGEKA